MICWVLAMEMLQGVWKQHLRPRAAVGYGVKICLPSPPNYVTRSPGWEGSLKFQFHSLSSGIGVYSLLPYFLLPIIILSLGIEHNHTDLIRNYVSELNNSSAPYFTASIIWIMFNQPSRRPECGSLDRGRQHGPKWWARRRGGKHSTKPLAGLNSYLSSLSLSDIKISNNLKTTTSFVSLQLYLAFCDVSQEIELLRPQ